MRPLITVLIVLLLLAIPANAQCPGGKCPVPEVAACDRDCDNCDGCQELVPIPEAAGYRCPVGPRRPSVRRPALVLQRRLPTLRCRVRC